jgi:hypothetical protein
LWYPQLAARSPARFGVLWFTLTKDGRVVDVSLVDKGPCRALVPVDAAS